MLATPFQPISSPLRGSRPKSGPRKKSTYLCVCAVLSLCNVEFSFIPVSKSFQFCGGIEDNGAAAGRTTIEKVFPGDVWLVVESSAVSKVNFGELCLSWRVKRSVVIQNGQTAGFCGRKTLIQYCRLCRSSHYGAVIRQGIPPRFAPLLRQTVCIN